MSKTPEEMAIDYCEPILSDDYARAIGRKDWIGTRCVKVGEGHEMYKAFLAGYKAGFEIGCMKGSMAMQWTLDSDWHFTLSVNHQKLADQMTKKEMKNK